MSDRIWDAYLTDQDKATLPPDGGKRVGFGTDRPCCWWISTDGSSATVLTSARGDEDLAGVARSGGLERPPRHSAAARHRW